MKDEKFSLEGKNAFKNSKNKLPINAIIIDATEIQIQRPKKEIPKIKLFIASLNPFSWEKIDWEKEKAHF